jgi:hypothetical protein
VSLPQQPQRYAAIADGPAGAQKFAAIQHHVPDDLVIVPSLKHLLQLDVLEHSVRGRPGRRARG